LTASPIQFDLLHQSATCHARIGRVTTLHGAFDTPAFMPVGTRGSVKGLFPHHVAETGAQIVLNNTYHLMLRPGSELIQQLGGVHRFMNWDGPILTDSGGYQAYSLADTNKVDDEGVTFKSIIDGKTILLTPELAMKVQNELGPDIMMALDDCPPPVDPNIDAMDAAQRTRIMGAVSRDAKAAATTGSGRARRFDHATRLATANERTVRWLERCKASHARPHDQALFGIVQGGTDLARRTWCAEQVANIELPGYAIGGVAVGELPEAIARVVQHTARLLPPHKPRYLMGVGYERDILTAVRAGVDMFDCVLPTRNGRNANAFTSTGQIRLKNNKYSLDESPIEPGCDCHACLPGKYGWKTPDQRPFTRAYLRHLFAAGEMLGPILVSLHNLRHYQRFMMDLRLAIRTEDWTGLVQRWPVLSTPSAEAETVSE
jgi:queuine tRNA-ribosyltransferase